LSISLYFFQFIKRFPFFVGKAWFKRALNTEVTVAMVEGDIEFTGSNREVLCKYVDGYLNQYNTLITCDQPISGRFVQLLFNATTAVNLYEVEVHGY